MEEDRRSPEEFLKLLQEEKEENQIEFIIYLGYSPGVGKTYQMLYDAHLLKKEKDITIGYVETHGRKETEELLKDLEIIPPKEINYNGLILKEPDIEAIIKRKPEIVIIDELAHTNAPGSQNLKRYQDVELLLENKIGVWTALNIEHIESINDIISNIIGVKIKETVPDNILYKATDIKVIDVPPEVLLKRLKEGKIYLGDIAKEAQNKFFRINNLIALRELALRISANKLYKDLSISLKGSSIGTFSDIREKILVGIYPSPFAENLIRIAFRMGNRINAEVVALYVETSSYKNLSQKEKDWLNKAIETAKSLEIELKWIKGENEAKDIASYAVNNNFTRIVIGKPKRFDIFGSFTKTIINNTPGIDIYMASTSKNINIDIKELKSKSIKNNFYNKSIPISIIAFLIAFFLDKNLTYLSKTLILSIPILISGFLFKKRDVFLSTVASLISFLIIAQRFDIKTLNYLILIGFIGILSYMIRVIKRRYEIAIDKEKSSNSIYDLTLKLYTLNNKDEIIMFLTQFLKKELNAEIGILLLKDEELFMVSSTENFNFDEKEKSIANFSLEKEVLAGFSTKYIPSSKNLYVPLVVKNKKIGVIGLSFSNKEDINDPRKKSFLESIAKIISLFLLEKL